MKEIAIIACILWIILSEYNAYKYRMIDDIRSFTIELVQIGIAALILTILLVT